MTTSRSMTYTKSTNVNVHCEGCPVGMASCFENLGPYKKECDFCRGFYDDTRTVECGFDELDDKEKQTWLAIAVKMKGQW